VNTFKIMRRGKNKHKKIEVHNVVPRRQQKDTGYYRLGGSRALIWGMDLGFILT